MQTLLQLKPFKAFGDIKNRFHEVLECRPIFLELTRDQSDSQPLCKT
jgi:hypothetical protein